MQQTTRPSVWTLLSIVFHLLLCCLCTQTLPVYTDYTLTPFQPQNSSTEILEVYQLHSSDFWSVSGDDAATAFGDIGFYVSECNRYQLNNSAGLTHVMSLYQVNVSVPLSRYVACPENTSCFGYSHDDANTQSVGLMRYANVVIHNESLQANWYSFPRAGWCGFGEPLTSNCTYAETCIVKSVTLACLHQFGWDGCSPLYEQPSYGEMNDILSRAFTFTSSHLGGCPDVTPAHLAACSPDHPLKTSSPTFLHSQATAAASSTKNKTTTTTTKTTTTTATSRGNIDYKGISLAAVNGTQLIIASIDIGANWEVTTLANLDWIFFPQEYVEQMMDSVGYGLITCSSTLGQSISSSSAEDSSHINDKYYSKANGTTVVYFAISVRSQLYFIGIDVHTNEIVVNITMPALYVIADLVQDPTNTNVFWSVGWREMGPGSHFQGPYSPPSTPVSTGSVGVLKLTLTNVSGASSSSSSSYQLNIAFITGLTITDQYWTALYVPGRMIFHPDTREIIVSGRSSPAQFSVLMQISLATSSPSEPLMTPDSNLDTFNRMEDGQLYAISHKNQLNHVDEITGKTTVIDLKNITYIANPATVSFKNNVGGMATIDDYLIGWGYSSLIYGLFENLYVIDRWTGAVVIQSDSLGFCGGTNNSLHLPCFASIQVIKV